MHTQGMPLAQLSGMVHTSQPIVLWTDRVTQQSCLVSARGKSVELELRLCGFRVQSFEFPSLTDAMVWANRWRPEEAREGRYDDAA